MFIPLQLSHNVTVTEFNAIEVKQYLIIIITFHNPLKVMQTNDQNIYNNVTQVNKLCKSKDCSKLSMIRKIFVEFFYLFRMD